MAFNFGGGAGGGGSNSGGFSFGNTSTPAENKPAQSTGFSFGNSAAPAAAAAPPASTGFSFGGGAAAAAPKPAESGSTGFSFGSSPKVDAKPAGGGFSFGSTGQSAEPASTGFSFGSTGGGLGGLGGASKPVETKNSTGFSFGSSPVTAVPATIAPAAAPPASTGFSFGAKPAAAAAPSPVTAAAPVTTTGFGFGAKPAAAASTGFSLGSADSAAVPVTIAAPVTTAATSTGFGFGAKPAEKPAAAAKTGFSFGSKPAEAAAKPAETSKPSTGFGFGATKTTPTTTTPASTGLSFGAKPAATLGATTAVTGSELTFEQLEDKINKWVHELSHQESLFLDQATKVNAWGLLVNENLDKLTDLDNAVKRVEGDQKAIDRELDLVVCMQQELKEMIDPLESDVDRQLEAQANRINLNSDRERMLNLTDMLDQQMFESADDLRSIIEQINQQKCDNKESSSITKISAILSNHIDTLNWVSSQTGSLDSKLEELRRNISALTMMN